MKLVRPVHIWVVTALVMLAVLVGFRLVWMTFENRRLQIPDEKAVGVALLAETLTGAEYFQESKQPADYLLGEGGPWISPQEAREQLDRVVRIRKFDAARTEKTKKLIAKLTEPHPSRVVGGDRIQLVRLNLALDQIKE